MIRAPLFLTLLFSVTVSSGQPSDTLESILQNKPTNSIERITALNLLARNLTFVNPVRAAQLTNEALQVSMAIQYKTGIAYAYRNLSAIHSFNDSYFISTEYLHRALDIFEETSDSIGIANCWIGLGHIFRRLQNRGEEIRYHKQSFEFFSRRKLPERIGVTAHNLGESYLNNGELAKCRTLTLYAIAIHDSLQNLPVLSSCYKAMGKLEYSEGNYQLAENYFNKVLEISDQLGVNSQKLATVESMIHLAQLNKRRGNKTAHLDFLKKASVFSQENNLSNYLQTIYTELIQYFLDENNQQQVQKYITEYNGVTASIMAGQLKDRSELTMGVIHMHDLEVEKIKLQENNLLQVERVKKRNIFLSVVVASLVMLGVFAIALKRANQHVKEVNQRLREQSKIIESQKNYLEELNNTKDKFFSIVAHDLKSPLTSLKSFSSLLVNHINNISKDEITAMSKQLQASIDNTLKMADNLITWAAVQMKDYNVLHEAIAANEIISNTYEVYKEVAAKKGITISCDLEDNLMIFGDKHQITFIIRNLVNNAIKFTPNGGAVTIRGRATPTDEIQIAVTDNGIGIPAEIKEKLFSVGRKHSTYGTAGEKGTGLGLIVSHEFVQLNHGKIEIESEEGQGTTFIVTLKRVKP